MGWLDEALRGAGSVVSGGISEAVNTVSQVVQGNVDPLAGAGNIALGAPIQVGIGAATVGTAILAGVTGNTQPLDTVTDVRDELATNANASWGLIGTFLAVGGAAGAMTGNTQAQAVASSIQQKLPTSSSPAPKPVVPADPEGDRRRAIMNAEDAAAGVRIVPTTVVSVVAPGEFWPYF